ncbi:MAG: hypothetical protein ACE5IO_10270 [Thermoplasmata archaeon]
MLKRELAEALDFAWTEGVRSDYELAFLWDGESCVHASLAYHLRDRYLSRRRDLRIWHEVRLPEMRAHIDMIMARVNEDAFISKQHLYDTWSDLKEEDYEILAAIEVKNAPTTRPTRDIRKLMQLVRRKGHGILPVLVLLEGTGSSFRVWVENACRRCEILLLYGTGERDPTGGNWISLYEVVDSQEE